MLALLAAAWMIAQPGTATHLSAPVAAQVAHGLLDAINDHRRAERLRLLTMDSIAQRAAQEQADGMAASGVLGHTDEYGRLPMTRYEVLGGDPRYYGENVGYVGNRYVDETDALTAVRHLDTLMMAERPPQDGHRENILSPHYQAVGIAFALGPAGLFLVEDFVGYRR